ncbi:hypothetical protein BGP_3393 [Beggiatoa sp. PS]|nr:hypothetical protein BGP_3393 [Beggiatoa sp. PS]
MQLTIELPDTLGYRLKSIPNLNEFMIKLLTQSLPASETQESWEEFLSNIEQYAIETGIKDLAENHDHYLYQQNTHLSSHSI